MDVERLYGGSFVDWERVSGSWAKRTVSSRLLLFASRRLLEETTRDPDAGRAEAVGPTPLPDEVKKAFASPPDPADPVSRRWGEFVDAAVAAEIEMVSYGERPLLLHELRSGLDRAAEQVGARTDLGLWFVARKNALPGEDLPDDPEYLPV